MMSRVYQQLFLIITRSILCCFITGSVAEFNDLRNIFGANASIITSRQNELATLALANALGFKTLSRIAGPSTSTSNTLINTRRKDIDRGPFHSSAQALEKAYKTTGRNTFFPGLGLRHKKIGPRTSDFSNTILNSSPLTSSTSSSVQKIPSRAQVLENAYKTTGRQRPFRSREIFPETGFRFDNLIPEPLDFGNGIGKISSVSSSISSFKINSSSSVSDSPKKPESTASASSQVQTTILKALGFNGKGTESTPNIGMNAPKGKQIPSKLSEGISYTDKQSILRQSTNKIKNKFHEFGDTISSIRGSSSPNRSPSRSDLLKTNFMPKTYNPFNPFLQERMPKFNLNKLPSKETGKISFFTQRVKPTRLLAEGSVIIKNKITTSRSKFSQYIRPRNKIIYRDKRNALSPELIPFLKNPLKQIKSIRARLRKMNFISQKKFPEGKLKELFDNEKEQKFRNLKKKKVHPIIPLINIIAPRWSKNQSLAFDIPFKEKMQRGKPNYDENQVLEYTRRRRNVLNSSRRRKNKIPATIRRHRTKINSFPGSQNGSISPKFLFKTPDTTKVPRTKLVRPQKLRPKIRSPERKSYPQKPKKKTAGLNSPKLTHITPRPGILRPVIPRNVTNKIIVRIPRYISHLNQIKCL